jgi:hypothetical protein
MNTAEIESASLPLHLSFPAKRRMGSFLLADASPQPRPTSVNVGRCPGRDFPVKGACGFSRGRYGSEAFFCGRSTTELRTPLMFDGRKMRSKGYIG